MEVEGVLDPEENLPGVYPASLERLDLGSRHPTAPLANHLCAPTPSPGLLEALRQTGGLWGGVEKTCCTCHLCDPGALQLPSSAETKKDTGTHLASVLFLTQNDHEEGVSVTILHSPEWF